jgi:uncharacterized repeat protein (TIGR03803 family)
LTKQWQNLLTKIVAFAVAAFASLAAQAQYTDLHDFDTPSLASPQYPGLLAQGRDGNLYGTAPLGGDFGRGGIFLSTPAGAYSVLTSFDGTYGVNPSSGLRLTSDGSFVGSGYYGSSGGFGTAFKYSSGVVAALHNFINTDGASVYAPPIQGTDGNYYGVTYTGGVSGVGVVYKITSGGVFSVLYQFDVTHGSSPVAPLIQGTDGNFYGTTKVGGTFGFGTAFKITATGVLTVLYNFDSTHGANIYAPLVQGSDGNFYGTARNGGTLNNGGVVFKLTPSKVLTVLHNFDLTTTTGDGVAPYAGLVQANDGNFYSVTSAGGANAAGTLYKITASGTYTKLFSFVGATGSLPFATLRQHTNGTFYGEASTGGAVGHGALFSYKAGLGPFVALPATSGRVATAVGILGGGLTGTTSVKFNGTAATFTLVSDTYITAKVPAGATTGFVTVVTSAGTLKSNQKFRVIPSIKTFSPSSGAVGIPVVITGVSLTGSTKVTFGAVAATSFTVDSDTQVTATVPTGAKTGKIMITTPGGTATSTTSFTVTP